MLIKVWYRYRGAEPAAIWAWQSPLPASGRSLGHELLLERIRPDAFTAVARSDAEFLELSGYLQMLFPELRLKRVDEQNEVTFVRSLRMARALAELGLAVGLSSGACLYTAIRLQQELGPESVVLTVFSDGPTVLTGPAGDDVIELVKVEPLRSL